MLMENLCGKCCTKFFNPTEQTMFKALSLSVLLASSLSACTYMDNMYDDMTTTNSTNSKASYEQTHDGSSSSNEQVDLKYNHRVGKNQDCPDYSAQNGWCQQY